MASQHRHLNMLHSGADPHGIPTHDLGQNSSIGIVPTFRIHSEIEHRLGVLAKILYTSKSTNSIPHLPRLDSKLELVWMEVTVGDLLETMNVHTLDLCEQIVPRANCYRMLPLDETKLASHYNDHNDQTDSDKHHSPPPMCRSTARLITILALGGNFRYAFSPRPWVPKLPVLVTKRP